MEAIMGVQTSIKPNGHAPHRRIGSGEAVCPTCKQPVTAAIQAKIEAEEKARQEHFEAELHKAKLKATEIAQREIDKAKRAALTEVAAIRKQAQLDRNAIEKAAKEAVMATLPTKIGEAVAAAKLEHAAEKLKLETALAEMQRRLQAKTPNALGEPSEISLFDALQTAFPGDRIWRVPKGQRGGDVIMEVVHGGEPIGKIVFDAKNYSPRRWSNAMTKKLRSDQLAEAADWGILVSTVFPSGADQLHIQDGVIVASPARTIVLTHLLRRQIVENHRLKLSAEARDEKAERLLAYIVSPTCSDLMDRIVKVTADMADLDRAETMAHQKVWAKRADFIRAVQDIHREFTDAVSAIIAGDPE